MAIEYTQSGFSFNTSVAEIAGVAHKIVSFEKYIVNDPIKETVGTIKTDLVVLDNAIKKAQNAVAAKALSALLQNIKSDYSAILSGIKAFGNSPDNTKKTAANYLSKNTNKIGSIFAGKTNEQLGNMISQVELLKKKTALNHLKTLDLESLLSRIETSIADYQAKYSERIEEVVDNKTIDATTAANIVVKDIQILRKKLTAYQEIGPNEDKFVSLLNNMWREAKAAQSLSNANKKKTKE